MPFTYIFAKRVYPDLFHHFQAVIAHRLSTVRDANAIMVLDHGQIIERGDHEDLLRQKGVYYKLYTGAFELE